MVNNLFCCWWTRIPYIYIYIYIYVTFNTTTRESPVTLFQEYMNFPDKTIRFLHVDNAKEFTCPVMVDLCNANNIILQVVVSYNHLMQDRVEGDIGICRQHTRVALPVTHSPVRTHERLSPAFAGTFRTVAVPFDVAKDKKHRKVTNKSTVKSLIRVLTHDMSKASAFTITPAPQVCGCLRPQQVFGKEIVSVQEGIKHLVVSSVLPAVDGSLPSSST